MYLLQDNIRPTRYVTSTCRSVRRSRRVGPVELGADPVPPLDRYYTVDYLQEIYRTGHMMASEMQPANEQPLVYCPDKALRAGLNLLGLIEVALDDLDITKPQRRRMFAEDVASLRELGRDDKFIVGVCGATGAGKSSLINAVLGEDLVPTSSARACTTVVTEIAYNTENKRDARIEFLSVEEWQTEVSLFLADLKDVKKGPPEDPKKLRADLKQTWNKMSAVYPDLRYRGVQKKTARDILRSYPNVTAKLGTEWTTTCSSSLAEFTTQLRPYLRASVSTETGGALWPLLRRVKIRCPAPVLATGAVIVDLPGHGDTNAARCAIAKNYLQSCLFSQATQAQLKLGELNQQAITFIGTKCDDLSEASDSSDEDFGLSDDPKYGELLLLTSQRQEAIQDLHSQCEKHHNAACAAEKVLKKSRALLSEHIKSIDESRGGSQDVKPVAEKRALSSKRKLLLEARDHKHKRVRLGSEVAHSGTGDHTASLNVDTVRTPSPSSSKDSARTTASDGTIRTHLETQVLEHNQVFLSLLDTSRKAAQILEDAQHEVQQLEAETQARRLRARSDYVKKCLRDVYRSRVMRSAPDEDDECDDSLGEEDSTVDDRDDEESDEEETAGVVDDGASAVEEVDSSDTMAELPVFMVSSQAYMDMNRSLRSTTTRASKQTWLDKGFLDLDDTGIPALRQWCHQLTLPRREADASALLSRLRPFAASLQTVIEGASEINEKDREMLRCQWASNVRASLEVTRYPHYRRQRPRTPTPSSAVGIGPTAPLMNRLDTLVKDCVNELRKEFKKGLNDKCQESAGISASKAYSVTAEFIEGVRYCGTYNAILRRDGCWKEHDLNEDLTVPFVEHVADSWCKVFETKHFASFEEKATKEIEDTVHRFFVHVPDIARARAERQRDSCLEEARATFSGVMSAIKEALQHRRREVFCRLVDHIRNALHEGYERALATPGGRGKFMRQKEIMKEFVYSKRDVIFDGAANLVLDNLSAAADAVGCALKEFLRSLSEKVEANLAVLWEQEFENEDPKVLANVLHLLQRVLDDVDAWQEAREVRELASKAHGDDNDSGAEGGGDGNGGDDGNEDGDGGEEDGGNSDSDNRMDVEEGGGEEEEEDEVEIDPELDEE
ncbi:hypothetical protein C2E23DRAFT_231950 [Lenzites betulinus]|nr:hypothetical protein C2E23DRAFT_231950 [Lenzites betulinus]